MELIDWLSVIVDIPIPMACALDVYLLRTFCRDKQLCPIFAWCLKNIFLTHMAIYFAEIFMHQFPANGLFLSFYVKNETWIGKMFFVIVVVWSTQSVYWNMIMAISRLWCVVSTISFKKFWDDRLQRWISVVIWGLNVVLSLHILIFVDCKSWPMNENSISFGTRTPNIITTLYSTYAPNVSLLITLLCYTWLIHALFKMTTFPTRITKQILLAQFLINIPKISNCVLTSYTNAQAYLFPSLPELHLKLFWFLAQIGGTFYGVNATIVIFICFPQSRDHLMRLFTGRKTAPVIRMTSIGGEKPLFSVTLPLRS